MKRVVISVSLFMLSGCSMFGGSKPFPLVETDPTAVRDCRPVGRYPGPSGYKYWGPPAVTGPFKLDTAEKARAAGATHIYWRPTGMGMSGAVTGFAFDCTGVDMGPDNGEYDE
jgi:hypothetical protein